jgi:hypothetical protein
MITVLKSPKGLKDLECEKGQLSCRPPIPYAPPTNLVTNKESPESLKIKLPNGIIFNTSIFSQGKAEKNLAHVVAVLRLINQKVLVMQCRKLAKAVEKLAGTFKNLQKSSGPTGSSSKDKKEAHKLELVHTQEMIQEAHKAHNKAVAKTYKLLRILLSSDPQPQQDRVCHKMHKCDSWAGVNSQMTTGMRSCLWIAF